MIVDVFPFFNEYKILDIRLKILKNHVDKFVIVEHDINFNNQPKPFRLESKIDKINAEFDNKIDYIKIHSKPMLNDIWDQEIYQKNNLSCALDLYPDAYFLFGDLDEVPNPKMIPVALDVYHKSGPCIFSLYHCLGRWNVVLERKWPGPVFGKKQDVIKLGGCRKFMCPRGSKSMHWKKPSYPELFPGGWHWSYFGESDLVSEKLDAVLEGVKIRRFMKKSEEKKIIENGNLPIPMSKFCGKTLDSIPEDLYPLEIKNILSNYNNWWK